MKIAIATEGTNVFGHFGKCENFTLVEVDNNEVKSKTVISTLENQHGLLPAFLASHNVNVVIAGGMGEGAKQKLDQNNIEAITGVSGSVEEAINSYINGILKSSGANCSSHEHSHSHGEGGCSCGHN
jgi:predicted Fe-Mo cluster-binding NifX family protein